MINLTLSDSTYVTTRKLDTFTQLHLTRKLAPAIPMLEGIVNPNNADKNKTVLSVLMLSQISDENANFVIHTCLGTVLRVQAGGAPAAVFAKGVLLFDDIDVETMLTLTMAVLEDNVGGFFHTALAGLKQQVQG